MSKCNICFDKAGGRVMRREVDAVCPACSPVEPINPLDDACKCPPLGEPKSY